MTKFEICTQSGSSIKSNAKTIVGAKREATAWATFGCDITIYADGVPLCRRKFWQNLNKFGWDKWENLA